MEEARFRRYRPAVRGGRHAALFIAVFALFPLGGAALAVTGSLGAGITLIVFGLFILTVLIFQFAALGRGYAIGNGGVLLKTLTSRLFIPFGSLESVSLLNQEQLTSFMENYYRPVAESERALDLAGWFRSVRRYGGLTRYVSATVTGTETRRGATAITGYRIHVRGDAVLLRTAEGDAYLATPVEAEGFCNRLRANRVAFLRPEEIPETRFTREDREAVRTVEPNKRLRTIIAVDAAVTLLVAAGVLTWFLVLKPAGQEEPVPPVLVSSSEEKGEPGEFRTVGFWEDDSLFLFAVSREIADANTAVDPGDLAPWLRNLALEAMILRYAQDSGVDPRRALKSSGREKLSDFLMLQSRIRISESGTSNGGLEYVMYSVEGSHIREYLDMEITRLLE